MDKNFSTVLRLKDVDDYITPAQKCIKPVKINQQLGTTKILRVEEDGTYTAVTEEGDSYKLDKVSITLNDCLACSGCITTAESVLISQHSCEVLSQFLKENAHIDVHCRSLVVVSVCPQSMASLATAIKNPIDSIICRLFDAWKVYRKIPLNSTFHLGLVRAFLTDFLLSLGVHLVLDTTWARDIVLVESGIEFVDHYNSAQSKTKTIHRSLPLFCAICPGWVCYAEKAHSGTASVPTTAIGEAFSIVPFLSQVRSPQQIIGRLVKSDNPEAIFHVTIMPCFDKKLEATRLEFSTESKNGDRTSDVDLVLATNELVQMISTCDVGHNWAACSPTLSSSLQSQLLNLQQRFQNLLPATDAAPAANLGPPVLYRHLGSGSGGYAASVFVHAAAELFSVVIADPFEDPRVIVRQLHNRDFQEMLLFATTADCDAVKQGLDQLPNKRIPFRHSKLPQTALLAFAVANGFRNIQNVVQRLKTACLSQTGSYSTSSSSTYRPSTFPFDYVEIMACPGGCLNGGGQITGSLTETKAFYEELVPVPPFSTPGTRNLYDYLTRSDPEHGNLRTTYRQVPKIEVINSAALRW